MHSAYIEEFGRNVMEAIAAGVPAIVSPRFREVFGDAACYAEAEGVENLIYSLWDAESVYTQQVQRGFDFVAQLASQKRVTARLHDAVHGIL